MGLGKEILPKKITGGYQIYQLCSAFQYIVFVICILVYVIDAKAFSLNAKIQYMFRSVSEAKLILNIHPAE